MNEAIARYAVDVVGQRIGVRVAAKLKDGDAQSLDLVPTGVHPNDSFTVRFSPGWRSAEAEFIPGKFAAPLIAQMGTAGPEGKSAFVAFASALDSRKTRLILRVNGMEVSTLDVSKWPDAWAKVELQARSAPQVIEQTDIAQMQQLIIDLVIPLFGMIAALIGVEEVEEESVYGEVEGRSTQTLVTWYERKKVNREACIQLKGLRCAACGFEFSEFYGPLGAGYIEIHHTTPVSQIGTDYRINVSKDLAPLCANCHAMVHRESPPVRIERLAELVAPRRQM